MIELSKHSSAYKDYCKGMHYKDIAKKYGVSLSTVKSWKTRYWNKAHQSSHKSMRTHKKVRVQKIHPNLLDNDKLSEKQKAFAYYYIKYFGDAYRAAIKAGYSESTAKVAKRAILKSSELRNAIGTQYRIAHFGNSFCHASINDVYANQLNIGAGVRQKRHYHKIDNKDPSQSTDITLIGPPAVRDQVNAGKTIIQFQHQSELTKAQANKMNADTKLSESKLPGNQDSKIRKPLFLDSVVKYHQDHEKSLKSHKN